MSRLRFILKQFPFIYPKRVVQSVTKYIDSINDKKGWYQSRRSSWYLKIESGEFQFNSPPKTVGDNYDSFFSTYRSYKTYDCSLFYLGSAFIYGNEGLILSKFNVLFQEFTHVFNVCSLRKYIYKNPFKFFTYSYIDKQGTAAILLSPQSHNFYHWFFDVLPRIQLYEPVLHEIDYFCVADNVPDNFLKVLPYFGIEEKKLLRIRKDEKVLFQHLYVSSLPGSEGRSGRWSIEYLRDRLGRGEPEEANVKYYLKRGDAKERNIINEKEVIDFLIEQGFEILDTGSISIDEQIRKMKKAALVIGMHGAALTNLLFTPSTCRVIEIHTKDYFRTDCFYTLASTRNLSYWYIVGQKVDNGNWGDITVSISQLKETINASTEE